jgi:hypothetical protein
MSAYVCSGHGARVAGKLASLYSAWFNADGVRTAWRQRLCADCVSERLGVILRSASQQSQDVTACPACGADSSKDPDPIYLTLYLPKQDPREYALTTDAACAAKLRVGLQERAEKLPNRLNGSGGGGSNRDDDNWAGVLG